MATVCLSQKNWFLLTVVALRFLVAACRSASMSGCFRFDPAFFLDPAFFGAKWSQIIAEFAGPRRIAAAISPRLRVLVQVGFEFIAVETVPACLQSLSAGLRKLSGPQSIFDTLYQKNPTISQILSFCSIFDVGPLEISTGLARQFLTQGSASNPYIVRLQFFDCRSHNLALRGCDAI
jgi:hypothetical protein